MRDFVDRAVLLRRALWGDVSGRKGFMGLGELTEPLQKQRPFWDFVDGAVLLCKAL